MERQRVRKRKVKPKNIGIKESCLISFSRRGWNNGNTFQFDVDFFFLLFSLIFIFAISPCTYFRFNWIWRQRTWMKLRIKKKFFYFPPSHASLSLSLSFYNFEILSNTFLGWNKMRFMVFSVFIQPY